MGFRISFLAAGAILAYFSLIGKIYNIQIAKGDYYTAKADALYASGGAFEPVRGLIYLKDKDGSDIPVAINKDYPTIYVNNKEIKDPVSTAEALAPIVGKTKEDLIAILGRSGDSYEPLLRRAGDIETQAAKSLGLPGVHIEYDSARYYPFGNLASQVLGFVSQDASALNKPLYGAELYYDDTLSGTGLRDKTKPLTVPSGEDIHLTIDRNIQSEGEMLLKNLIDKSRSASGSFIVMDPKTGKVLGMGGHPDFDPNSYGKSPLKDFLNTNIQSLYEPGSVMKIITMASAIDAGAVTPETSYYDSGSVVLNKKTIHNFDLKKYGKITMTNVIEHSVNTGAVFAERAMGNQTFYDYMIKFGFNAKTGIDLPGELNGNLSPLEKSARDINFATASFGQGVSATPLEMINAVAAVANHGILMRPYVNAGDNPQAVRQVISSQTSEAMTQIMVDTVNVNQVAKIDGYNIAAKTGTAQVPDLKNGGYTEDVENTFIGYAPATDPRLIILMKLDKPAGAPSAGSTVIPAWRELMHFALNYYGIPPDNVDH